MTSNGRFPLNRFVHRGGNIYLSPSLNARWNEGVRLGVEKYGVRLYITGDIDGLGGWNGYRPYDPQVAYRRHYGIMAAVPGTSSHGGVYRGQEVFAVDVANWRDLAPGNESLAWARFVSLMRIVGLTVDFVSPRELWHVGDFNPAWTVPTFGAVAVNPSTTNRPVRKEDDMTVMIKAAGNIYVFSHGQIKLSDNVDEIRDGLASGIEQKDLGGTVAEVNAQLARRMNFYGIPQSVVCTDGVPRSMLDGNGHVLNPETNRYEKNGLWSWERLNRATNAVIQAQLATLLAKVK